MNDIRKALKIARDQFEALANECRTDPGLVNTANYGKGVCEIALVAQSKREPEAIKVLRAIKRGMEADYEIGIDTWGWLKSVLYQYDKDQGTVPGTEGGVGID